MAGYPDFEGFGYTFGRGELTLGRGIYIAIGNVQFDQPTTEGVVMGTRPWPLMRTEGEMGIGDGTITFTEAGEWARFIDDLGNGFRSKIWGLKWTLTATGRPNVKLACQSCRVLANPVDHGTGEEALGGEIKFSFMSHTVNGKTPHLGMPAPLR